MIIILLVFRVVLFLPVQWRAGVKFCSVPSDDSAGPRPLYFKQNFSYQTNLPPNFLPAERRGSATANGTEA